MKLYVAGPMRGVAEFNFPAFNQAAERLRKEGFDVFNPAERDASVGLDTTGLTGNEDLDEDGFSLREALAADLAFITEEADAVVLLDGWGVSKGAAAEVATARALDIPVVLVKRLLDEIDTVTDIETLRALDIRNVPTLPGTTTGGLIGATYSIPEAYGAATSVATGTFEQYISPHASARAKNMAADVMALLDREVRTTSATGGQKGTKLERFDLIPIEALAALARHYGIGAQKYDDNNWRKGYEWSKSYAALVRHLTAFWGGEDIDPETGSPHIIAVMWHAVALYTFMQDFPEYDDRWKGRPE